MTRVSVVIITKSRAADLRHCLGSLATQSLPLDELIIIDNDSVDETTELVSNFVKTVNFKIRLITERKVGYPGPRNRGLVTAAYSWVAFIDDDCVAHHDWYRQLKLGIKRHPQAAAILGRAETYDEKNVFSLVAVMLDQEWKRRSLYKDKVFCLEILDTKNIVYSAKFLKKNKIKFDETRSTKFLGASEDCDLGMQIQQSGGSAFYHPQMLVWHQDPRNLSHFVQQQIVSWKSYRTLFKKWNLKTMTKSRKPALTVQQLVVNFSQNHQLGLMMQAQLFLVAKLVMLINRFLVYSERWRLRE